jgi:SAM-dependent methyltransferase
MIWKKLKQILMNSYFHPRYIANREITNTVAEEGRFLYGRMLDVGCGKKPYAHLLPMVNHYVGIDIPTSMHGLSNINVIASGLALPFESQSSDSILCTEVLEHTPDPLLSLQEMQRVAKEGGVLLLTVPLSEQIHEEPHDYYRFTEHALRWLLSRSGWKILRLHQRGGTWLELGYRLSSALYCGIGAWRDQSGQYHPRVFLGPLTIIGCTLIQIAATILDKIIRIQLSTIGYVVLAQKE